jgi:hypothetical protein
MQAGQTYTSVQRCPFLKKSPAYSQTVRGMFSVWWYYKHAFVPDGRMIVENHSLILHIFQMMMKKPEKRFLMNAIMDVIHHQQVEREARRS